MNCKNCNLSIDSENKFCPYCGATVNELEKTFKQESDKIINTISSSGNYSGTMVKGKKSRGWKILRNTIIAIVLVGIIAIIIWFQVDPDAGEKLTNILFGLGFMAVFAFFIYRAAKKGKFKGKRGYNRNDDDWDDIDDDGGDDD